MDLSSKHCIVYDRAGLYTYFAQRLGKEFGTTQYFIPDASAYPESPKAQMGKGLPEIERIDDKQFWKNKNKADIIAFPDCYDGGLQHSLREEGHCVFGSGLSERMEIDKIFFLDTLEKLGLNVPYTEVVAGIDDLLKHLTGKGEKWIKSLWRGDFETRKFTTMKQFQNWLYQYLLPKIGKKSQDIEVLVQNPIKAACEVGYDGNRVDGVCTPNHLLAFEVKDKGLVGKIFHEPPKIIKDINDAMTPEYAKLGYRGSYSNEIRITEDGKAYPIDETTRIPSPPGELMMEMYENYPEMVWHIANGEMPDPKPVAPYGAEIILTCDFFEEHEICVEVPEEIESHVKLKCHYKKDGAYYAVPSGNGAFYGAVVATGNTMKEATEKCSEVAEMLVCDDSEFDKGMFEKASEQVEKGKRFGIEF